MKFYRVMKRAGQKGFSLVELMIVVAIIGILASLAVPKFQIFQAKAKQSEAKNNLSHVYTLEQTFYGDNDRFGTHTEIGFIAQGGNVGNGGRYNVTATSGGGTFLGTAAAKTANSILAGCTSGIDTWTINESKALLNPVNCAK